MEKKIEKKSQREPESGGSLGRAGGRERRAGDSARSLSPAVRFEILSNLPGGGSDEPLAAHSRRSAAAGFPGTSRLGQRFTD